MYLMSKDILVRIFILLQDLLFYKPNLEKHTLDIDIPNYTTGI